MTPTGAFTVSSPYTWNLTNLYTTGEVTLLASSTVPDDFDLDGDVDGRDFLAWQRGGSPTPLSTSDLADWQANFGTVGPLLATSKTVPEPGGLWLLTTGLLAMLSRRVVAA